MIRRAFDNSFGLMRSKIIQGGIKMTQQRTVDAAQRRAEIVIATLFLLTAAASIPAAFVLDPILNAPDYLARVFPNKGAVDLGALLWSINNIGIVFIAVFAFGL